jgi:hypothetical protein
MMPPWNQQGGNTIPPWNQQGNNTMQTWNQQVCNTTQQNQHPQHQSYVQSNAVPEGFDEFALVIKRASIAEALVKFIHKGT